MNEEHDPDEGNTVDAASKSHTHLPTSSSGGIKVPFPLFRFTF